MHPALKQQIDQCAVMGGFRSVDEILAAQKRRGIRASLRVVAENTKETKTFYWTDPDR